MYSILQQRDVSPKDIESMASFGHRDYRVNNLDFPQESAEMYAILNKVSPGTLVIIQSHATKDQVSRQTWIKRASHLFSNVVSFAVHEDNPRFEQTKLSKNHLMYTLKCDFFDLLPVWETDKKSLETDKNALLQAIQKVLSVNKTLVVFISYKSTRPFTLEAWLRHRITSDRFAMVTKNSKNDLYRVWNYGCIGSPGLIDTFQYAAFRSTRQLQVVSLCDDHAPNGKMFSEVQERVLPHTLFASQYEAYKAAWTSEDVDFFWADKTLPIFQSIHEWALLVTTYKEAAKLAITAQSSKMDRMTQANGQWFVDHITAYTQWMNRLRNMDPLDYDILAIHIFPTKDSKPQTPRWIEQAEQQHPGRVLSFYLVHDQQSWDFDHNFPMCYHPFGENMYHIHSLLVHLLQETWVGSGRQVVWTMYHAQPDDLFTTYLKQSIPSPLLTIVHIGTSRGGNGKGDKKSDRVCIWKEPFDISNYSENLDVPLEPILLQSTPGTRPKPKSPIPPQTALVCTMNDPSLYSYIFGVLVPPLQPGQWMKHWDEGLLQHTMHNLTPAKFVQSQTSRVTGGKAQAFLEVLSDIDVLWKVESFTRLLKYLETIKDNEYDFLIVASNPNSACSQSTLSLSSPAHGYMHLCTFLQRLYNPPPQTNDNAPLSQFPAWLGSAFRTDQINPLSILCTDNGNGEQSHHPLLFEDCIPNVFTTDSHLLGHQCHQQLKETIRRHWLDRNLPVLFSRHPEHCQSLLLPWLKMQIPDIRLTVASGDRTTMHYHKTPYTLQDHLASFDFNSSVDGADEYRSACSSILTSEWSTLLAQANVPVTNASMENAPLHGTYTLPTRKEDMNDADDYRSLMGLLGVESIKRRNQIHPKIPQKLLSTPSNHAQPQQSTGASASVETLQSTRLFASEQALQSEGEMVDHHDLERQGYDPIDNENLDNENATVDVVMLKMLEINPVEEEIHVSDVQTICNCHHT